MLCASLWKVFSHTAEQRHSAGVTLFLSASPLTGTIRLQEQNLNTARSNEPGEEDGVPNGVLSRPQGQTRNSLRRACSESFTQCGLGKNRSGKGQHHIQIITSPVGFNEGRVYFLKANSRENASEWVSSIKTATKMILTGLAQELTTVERFRLKVREYYVSSPATSFFMILIGLNFVVSILESETRPGLPIYAGTISFYLSASQSLVNF